MELKEMSRAQLKERKEALISEARDLASGGDELTGNDLEKFETLEKDVKEVSDTLERHDHILRGVNNPNAVEHPEHDDRPKRRDVDTSVPPHVRQSRDAGLRTIERHEDILSREAGDNLDNLVRRRDPQGVMARYLDAVGNPHYNSAIGKFVADPTSGHLRFSPEEVESVRRVSAVEHERTMNVTTGSAGNWAIPFSLDPSILLSSSGVLNPIRSVARVESISTLEWKGVSSDGITAAFAAESTEASDNSPTLVQPTARAEKAFAFVPFTFELGDDWGSFQSEMARLFADSKDVLEATKFLTGTGTNEPAGLLTGLTTTQRVQTAGAGAFAIGDNYLLKQGLGPRFTANATVMAHSNRYDSIYRMAGGGSTEPPILPTREGPWLGVPKVEWSTMATAVTTGTKAMIYGDAQQFGIFDRIGGQLEIIPNLMGANRRPTGERGLFYWWRVGSKVLVPNAFRYLEIL